jgi:hypothetical protein
MNTLLALTTKAARPRQRHFRKRMSQLTNKQMFASLPSIVAVGCPGQGLVTRVTLCDSSHQSTPGAAALLILKAKGCPISVMQTARTDNRG